MAKGVCMAKGAMHGEGGCVVKGGMHCEEGIPPGHHEIQSVNARPVRILLECILVKSAITNVVYWSSLNVCVLFQRGFRNILFSSFWTVKA